jgi:hypothetical protein
MSATPTAVRFPPGMLDQINVAAQDAGTSRNAWIVNACRHRLDLVAAFEALAESDAADPKPAPGPTLERLSFDIECRSVAGRWQWRVAGSDEIGGTVSFRRDVTAAAREALAEKHGVPVDVRLT